MTVKSRWVKTKLKKEVMTLPLNKRIRISPEKILEYVRERERNEAVLSRLNKKTNE